MTWSWDGEMISGLSGLAPCNCKALYKTKMEVRKDFWRCSDASFEEEDRSHEARNSRNTTLKAEKGKEMDPPLVPPEWAQYCQQLCFSPVKPILGPGRSTVSQRVRQDWSDLACTHNLKKQKTKPTSPAWGAWKLSATGVQGLYRRCSQNVSWKN